MSRSYKNSYETMDTISVDGSRYTYFNVKKLDNEGVIRLAQLPFSIRILLENVLRNEDGHVIQEKDISRVANYNPGAVEPVEIPFMPARVILQDFTGVPAIVDLAAMRDAVKKFGGDPDRINPVVPADLVIDHSVQVDQFGTPEAFLYNVNKEYQRNNERYALLKWAQMSFKNFSAVPPGTGIVHQVNLEYLAQVIMTTKSGEHLISYPDTLVGTDSHTTMINGLSVLGWGVGGIEAEAVMLGQPYYMILPEVVGVKLTGRLPEGATATDLVLRVTEMLRDHGVVGKFVEFFGKGLSSLSLPDRATIANMSPEYGATMGFFPIDEAVLSYLRLTNRPADLIQLVEVYAKEQQIFRTDDTPDPSYHAVLELDMNSLEPSLAGPKRPQDRIPLSQMKPKFEEALQRVFGKNSDGADGVPVEYNDERFRLHHGSVVISAITSCTNTSNPSVMISAGLVARKAAEKGLRSKPGIKTSLAPGSRVVTEYLKKSGLLSDLEKQNFHLVGYGCTTCIGNSGPLPDPIDKAIEEGDIVAAAVLSGNRNFEGRIHSSVRANYLASPPLVVAYALAGTVHIDFEKEPIGKDQEGEPVFLKDIWPTQAEITQILETVLDAKMFEEKYSQVYEGDEHWQRLKTSGGKLYEWDPDSTYIKNPPFFSQMDIDAQPPTNIQDARVIALLGDSVTTDHISPAGTIPQDSPAGKYLLNKGVKVQDFNSYGSRRGNHEVMMRGTFGNIRIKNKLLENVEGGYTIHFPSGKQLFIYDAAMEYKKKDIPLIVMAGKEYGTGSSRDWAAKGTFLLGIKAVIAESFERIHRSNLVGMGVLPLQFMQGENYETLNLDGTESYHIDGIAQGLKPGKTLPVRAIRKNHSEITFQVKTRLDTPFEVEYYENGGILQTVLRQMIKDK